MPENFYAILGKQVDNPNTAITEFEGAKLLEPTYPSQTEKQVPLGKVPMEARIQKVEAENVKHAQTVIKRLNSSTSATFTVVVKEAAWKETGTSGSAVYWAVIGKVKDGPNVAGREFEGGKLLEVEEQAGFGPYEARIAKCEGSEVGVRNLVQKIFPSTTANKTVLVTETEWKEA